MDNFAWRGSDANELYSGNGANDHASAQGGDDSLSGGLGNDILYGGTGNDVLNGDDGNDTLYGSSQGDCILDGGAGNDVLEARGRNDSLSGGEGDDRLYVGGLGAAPGDKTDTLQGGDGNDQLFLGGERTNKGVLTGGAGADRFVLAYDSVTADDIASDANFTRTRSFAYSPVAAPDRITDFNAAEGDLLRTGIINGLGGDTRDNYTPASIPVVWRGTANADFKATVGQSMALAGSDPNDTRFLELWAFYDGATSTTYLFMDRNRDFAVDSNDFLLAFDGNVALGTSSFTAGTFAGVKVGTAGNDSDTLPPLSAGIDIAFGLDGNDNLDALEGNDFLNGDGGNDSLSGGQGNDNVYGGADDDVLNGDSGCDWLYGGSGADTLNGGDDVDTLFAEGRQDGTATADATDAAGTRNVLNGGAGADSLVGGNGDDELNGEADNDTLFGSYSAGLLSPYFWVDWNYSAGSFGQRGGGNDTLSGGAGNDALYACGDNDSLSGDAGDDRLYVGGWGAARGDKTDTLQGGDGNDQLFFGWGGGANKGVFTGGAGADNFDLSIFRLLNDTTFRSNFTKPDTYLSPVVAPDRITDFNAAEGDRLRSGIVNGLGGGTSSSGLGAIPVVWRGTANADFKATVGQSMTLAGSDSNDTRLLELWTFYDGATNTTYLFMDRNRDFAVDSNDFLLAFDGNVALGPSSFTAGTFRNAGTAGNDSDTLPPLSAGNDIAYGLPATIL